MEIEIFNRFPVQEIVKILKRIPAQIYSYPVNTPVSQLFPSLCSISIHPNIGRLSEFSVSQKLWILEHFL